MLLASLAFGIEKESAKVPKTIATPWVQASWRSPEIVRISQVAAGIQGDLPEPRCGVSAFRMTYQIQNNNGPSIKASALLQVPNCKVRKEMPLLIYNHSTRVGRQDVPSRQAYDPESWATAMMFASYGVMVALPDYRGFGASDVDQIYLSKTTGEFDVYSLIQAVYEWTRSRKIQLNQELFIAGYSQGAHVTLSALEKLENFPVGKLKLMASAALSGVYGLDAAALDYVLKNGNAAHSTFVIMCVMTQLSINSTHLPDGQTILRPDSIVVGKKLLSGALSFKDGMRQLPDKPSGLFTADYLKKMYAEKEQNALVKLLANESVDRLHIKTPTLVFAVKADETASSDGARISSQRLKQNGTPVTLVIRDDRLNHVNASLPAFLEARQYFSTLSPKLKELLGATFAPLK